MARRKGVLSFIVLMSVWCLSLQAQSESGFIKNINFQAGAGFEYLNRTIAWDGSEETSKLKAMQFTFRPGLILNDRITIGGIIGYTLADHGSMILRDVPLSRELDMGNLGGMLFGGELEAVLAEMGNFEIGIQGEYVYYNGKEDSVDIPDLAVEGSMSAKPKWQRWQAGLQLSYIAYAYLYPYVRIAYDDISGTYEVQQTILDLTGSQERDLNAHGVINATVGLFYEPMERFLFKAEIQILPNKDAIDLGVAASLSYLF